MGVGGGPGDGRPPSELRADWPPSFLLPRSVAAPRRAGDDAYLGVIYPADDFVVYGCAGRGGGKGGTGWWRATARRLDPNHRPSPRLSSYVTATRVKLMLAAADPLAIAPSPDGRTNAIAARPPSAFVPSYGDGSAARHGGTPVVRPGLARDLDTPADLQEFQATCR